MIKYLFDIFGGENYFIFYEGTHLFLCGNVVKLTRTEIALFSKSIEYTPCSVAPLPTLFEIFNSIRTLSFSMTIGKNTFSIQIYPAI